MEYTIILVDDESLVRRSIKNNTPWSDYGFRVIGEANNGIEALELVEELKPDVVISDIRMPYLDGIGLIKELKRVYPNTIIIILSGYDEFTYAQTAIKYNVKEYILKPVSKKDFCDLLERTKKNLDDNYKKINDINKLESQYKMALPLLKEKFLVSLLTPTKGIIDIELIQKGKSFGYNINKGNFIVATLESNKNDSPLIAISMLEACKEIINRPNTIQLQVDEQIVIIFTNDHTGLIDNFIPLFLKQVLRELEKISSYLNKYLKGGVTIGLGNIVSSPSMINQSYKEALVALNYKTYQENQNIIYINDVERIQHPTLNKDIMIQRKDEFINTLKMGSEDEVKTLVTKFFDEYSGLNPEGLQSYLLSLLAILANLTISYKTSITQILSENENRSLLHELATINTVSKAKRWFTDLSLSVNKSIKGEREQSHIQFVEDAKKYIEDHYSEKSLCLESVCDYLGVSTAYFSTTFKKETGKSFVVACNETRINMAKQLMRESNLKNYEISEKIGFSDSNYFSFCFKRVAGISPSKYKNEI
ncbi:MAG: response regulator [Spirochaetaceae bacterium]|nr:response regulator [Spirochaetaceae bacterium]